MNKYGAGKSSVKKRKMERGGGEGTEVEHEGREFATRIFEVCHRKAVAVQGSFLMGF